MPPQVWRNIPARYRLEASICKKCNSVYYPPLNYCKNCKNQLIERITLSKVGKIISFTQIHQPPEQLRNQAPYIIALIELSHGIKITAQLTDCNPDEITPGMPVKAVLRKIGEDGDKGIIYYGIKFRPLLESELKLISQNDKSQ